MEDKRQNDSKAAADVMKGGSVPLLEQRMYQAQIAEVLIKRFADAVGYVRAIEVATSAIQASAEESGRKMAERYGGNSLKELRRVVEDIWCAGDALDLAVTEETERTLFFDVTRCRYAELYETMGIRELGVCLSCSRDASFVSGFNPEIRMERTQTIMEGAPCCDFRFFVE